MHIFDKTLITNNLIMKKELLSLLLLFIMVSCNDQKEPIEKAKTPCSVVQLSYPQSAGTSGNGEYGLLGFGYDATGYRDTLSVKAKVVISFPTNTLYTDHPNTSFPTILSGSNFKELSERVNAPFHCGQLFSKHLEALLKLANASEAINAGYAFTYYSLSGYTAHYSFYTHADIISCLNPEFKQDITSMSAQQIVEKYGTHVLQDIFQGFRFEILYFCKSGTQYPIYGDVCEDLFYKRMLQFMGGTPMILRSTSKDLVTPPVDEKMIYNSIGSSKKMCAIINATDYNPDSIRIDAASAFKNENIKYQFAAIGSSGLLPLYDLITDEAKKQEVKTYIEKLLVEK